MLLKNLKNDDVNKISGDLAMKLTTHPLFMFLCKNESLRQEFIEVYFKYYIRKWNKDDILLCDESNNSAVSLVSLKSLACKISGRGASNLKKYKNPFANILFYTGNLIYLTNIVAPENIESRIMTVYSVSKYNDSAKKLIDEAIRIADENKYMLVYETFSKKLIDYMKQKGFETAYEKQFSSTQFFETIMVYYHDDKKPAKLIDGFKRIEIPKEEQDKKAPSEI